MATLPSDSSFWMRTRRELDALLDLGNDADAK